MEIHEIKEIKEVDYQLADLSSEDLDRITELEKRLSDSTNEDIALVAVITAFLCPKSTDIFCPQITGIAAG